MWWLGVDVGGTFTDAVAYDDAAGRFVFAKVPSTPADPAIAVLEVIEQLPLRMPDVQRFAHGVTIGTNAILQERGAKAWMLVTEGFRDVLEIARTNRTVLYDIKLQKPRPVIPRSRTIEVAERRYADGAPRVALDEAGVMRAASTLAAEGAGALAICFLHSYANPEHEQRAASLLQKALPTWFISLSSDVLPQIREYERFNTTALNTVIGPLMGGYLDRLQDRLAKAGYSRPVFITTSNGGVSTASRARRLPISTVLSGPAGGVAAAIHLGRLIDEPDLITCDMGGTSTDVCLIQQLNAPMTNEQFIGGHANRTPQIAIKAIGAGGGSIAWLDRGNILKIGPQSAGASPGPACYGQGGDEPTVTDANLLLGRLDPGSKLAGRIGLNVEAARTALSRLHERVGGIGTDALAEGVVRIAVTRMVSAIKQISVAEGYDPRDFALMAYGGAGPMHAAFIADELEIDRIIVPVSPGNFCAFGALISDIRLDRVLTRTVQVRADAWAEIDAVLQGIAAEARAEMAADGVDPASITVRRSLGMRYVGQSWELAVNLDDTMDSVPAVEACFADVHSRRFGHAGRDASEIVTFSVSAIGAVPKPALPVYEPACASDGAAHGERSVYFGSAFVPTPTYARTRLPRAAVVSGPAVIDEEGATTVVPPGWTVTVLSHGDLLLNRTTA